LVLVSRINFGVGFSKFDPGCSADSSRHVAIFVVDRITEIQWQTDAFHNLVLPKEQKDLIKALVESHRGAAALEHSEDQFDDFIVGKGRGLIINLFGPPGVGKTLSAEATSECKGSAFSAGVRSLG
jgi:ATP-dependent Lon protease